MTQDFEKINRMLITLLLTALTVIGAFLIVKSKQPALYALIPGIPIGIYLFANPSKFYVALVLVSYARLMIPGLPSTLELVEFMSVALVGCVFFVNAMQKNLRAIPEKSDLFMWGFILVMFLTMAVRGFGMRLTGGTDYGGSHYFKLLALLLVYPIVARLTLNERETKVVAWGSVFAAAIPLCIAFAIVGSRGRLYFLHNFVGMNVGYLMPGVVGDVSGVRWEQFAFIAGAMQVVAFAYPFKRNIWRVFLLGLAFILVMRSGFRGNFFSMCVLTVLWLLYKQKTFEARVRLLALFGIAGVIAWGMLILLSPHLPLQMQRAISFVPGVQINEEIARSASDSAMFRVEIWRYALPDLPKYLLVGRGMLLDVTEVAWMRYNFYGSPEYFYLAHSYHSGIMHFLVDFGLPGLLMGVGFFLSTSIEAWRGVKAVNQNCEDPFIRNFYTFSCILLSWKAFGYFFMFGDMDKIFTSYILLALLLRILRKRYVLADQTKAAPAGASRVRIPCSNKALVRAT